MQEINGRKLLLAFENGEIVAKEVVLVRLSECYMISSLCTDANEVRSLLDYHDKPS